MFTRISRTIAARSRAIVPLAALVLAGFGCEDTHVAAPSDAGKHAVDSGSHEAGSGGSGGAAEPDAGSGEELGAGGDGACAGSGGAGGQAAGDSQQSETVRGTSAADQAPQIDDAAYAKLIAQLNKFGLDLGRKQAELNNLTKQNIVYSPLSASIALSMTYAGAKAKTADEFKTVLGGGIDAAVHNTGINRLRRELASRERREQDSSCSVRKIELNIADAVYVEKTLSLQPDFLDQLSRSYDSGVHVEDFIDAFEPARIHINDWVASETHDRIKDLLVPGDIDDLTRVVLVNALYFYGSWATPFIKQLTRDAEFHTLAGATVTVPTMHGGGSLRYSEGKDFVGVELPYTGNELQMFLVLPNDGQFETLRQSASAEWLKAATESAKQRTVSLALPKFKMTIGPFRLKQSLENLGLTTAFSNTADFTGISLDEPLHISDVIQKAFIGVDEAGTEAAAATAVIVSAGSAAPTDIVPLNLDRPFLFFIHDKNGTVLFSGQVVDPSKED